MGYKNEPELDSPKLDHKTITDYLYSPEETDVATVKQQEMADFERLLAQYKGKVLEKYAHVFR